MADTEPNTPWTCESCGDDNGPDDEHCQNCDQWRSEQEDN